MTNKKGTFICKNCDHEIEYNKPRDIYIHRRNPSKVGMFQFNEKKYNREILLPCFCGCKRPEHESEKDAIRRFKSMGIKGVGRMGTKSNPQRGEFKCTSCGHIYKAKGMQGIMRFPYCGCCFKLVWDNDFEKYIKHLEREGEL